MMLYVLISVLMSVSTGELSDQQYLTYTPMSLAKCSELQSYMPIETVHEGKVKLYACEVVR